MDLKKILKINFIDEIFKEYLFEGYSLYKDNALYHKQQKIEKKYIYCEQHNIKSKITEEHKEFI